MRHEPDNRRTHAKFFVGEWVVVRCGLWGGHSAKITSCREVKDGYEYRVTCGRSKLRYPEFELLPMPEDAKESTCQ